jgi:hypothetical protein
VACRDGGTRARIGVFFEVSIPRWISPQMDQPLRRCHTRHHGRLPSAVTALELGHLHLPASAGKEYTARMEREARALPEADWQAEASDEIEMELQ